MKTFNYSFKPCPEGYLEAAALDAKETQSSLCPAIKNQFPGTYEVAWGQDDAINGQTLTGGVVRIRGFYPLPFATAIHLFGGVNLSLKHKNFVNGSEFVLAPGNITPTTAGVFRAAELWLEININLVWNRSHSNLQFAEAESTTKDNPFNCPKHFAGWEEGCQIRPEVDCFWRRSAVRVERRRGTTRWLKARRKHRRNHRHANIYR